MKKIYLMISLFLLNIALNAQDYSLGADLSYVNELEDCGAVYYETGTAKDVYTIFSDHQARVVRLRVWHTPEGGYSGFSDVKKSISRAKATGMKVLLDFHYSDTWADPGKQTRPQAWSGITDLNVLADSVYNYTFQVLSDLKAENLLPEFVQIGNETNGNIMVEAGETLYPIDWPRNIQLFKAGIQAAKETDSSIQTVIHIADPTVAVWWFTTAAANNFSNYDIIGLSYYPEYHDVNIAGVGQVVTNLKSQFSKPVWIVETGYPWTLGNNGDSGNILGEASILPGYSNPPTIKSQKNFLINLTYAVISNGGMGVIYWEPAWVTTTCTTQWGQGSHYENAAFFDFDNQLHAGIDFLSYDYSQAPSTTSEVSFYVDMTEVEVIDGVFVTGDFTGTAWQFMTMEPIGNNVYQYTTTMQKGSEGAYIFTIKADWNMELYHEQVPLECAPMWGTHRKYVIEDDTETYAFYWSSCDILPLLVNNTMAQSSFSVYPNPFRDQLNIRILNHKSNSIHVYSADGRLQGIYDASTETIDGSSWSQGFYLIQLWNEFNTVIDSVKVFKSNN
ncbi:MAG: hypothetical protein CVT99_00395 [Bacteroidetes bacterium HGW-Bacteroidetes-16]|jgi:arabinogalactan endo-1,4-beta-galactosidase|nr:MAG: hypothetical protein CVT99_00395 [Bacteroidetes bacterium HGW-Bacteroidetes-16]